MVTFLGGEGLGDWASFKIINGPMHGEMIEPDSTLNVKSGDFYNLLRPGRLFKSPNDMPIRYACPSFFMKYHLIGDYAYYLGEERSVSPIVEDAERILGPIV